jgi:hypothetical protein
MLAHQEEISPFLRRFLSEALAFFVTVSKFLRSEAHTPPGLKPLRGTK